MGEGNEGKDSLLDPDVLAQLIGGLQGSDIDELEIEFGESRLFLRREPGRQAVAVSPQSSGASGAPDGVPISAPLTGVYYSRPTPDTEPFASAGSLVHAGQVVGLIETMKLFNEVVSEVSGEVISVAVRDGDLVEAGHPLMFVRVSSEVTPA